MQLSQVPTKFSVPWANSAGTGYIRQVPTASQIGITNGAASLTDGFPPLCFLPVGSGGVPPFGQDMNGILNQITLWNQWNSAGGLCLYDSGFSGAVGGYPKGAILASSTVGQIWLNTVDNNTTNPDSGGSNWVKIVGTGANPNYVPYPGWQISGFVPSAISGTATTASMTISGGTASDSTHQASVSYASTFSWAVSNGNAANGYQGGSTLPSSSTIYMYAIWGASGVATFASTSLSPTLPSGYTYYRLTFAFTTNGSGAPIPFSALEGDGSSLICYLTTPVLDVNDLTLSASRQLVTLSVPTGIIVEWMGSFQFVGSVPPSYVYWMVVSPSEPDVAPQGPSTFSAAPLCDQYTGPSGTPGNIPLLNYKKRMTNTSGQLGIRGNTSYSGIYGSTTGWVFPRRQ